ncbi:MAG: IS200/IS605 family transposase [Bacteroidota bacterium]
MPQSLVKNYVHIVFSTKKRQSFIDQSIEEELHAYLGGTCKELGCPVLAVGGVAEHVHILCMLSRNIALSELVGKVKANSSKWIKTKGEQYATFYWQKGYGGFSVNPAETEVVIIYIQKQEEHHKKWTFKEEYRLFLKKYKVEYDERYVWD